MLILPNRNGFSSSPQWVQQLDQWRPMACWTSLFFPVGSGLILQPTMGPTAGPMACRTSLIFQIRSGLVLQPAMGPAAGPMACPLWNGLNHTAHYGSSSCTNGLLDKLVLPSWERFFLQPAMGPVAGPVGLLDKLDLPNTGAV